MANVEHLKILGQGIDTWNTWRKAHRDVRPDFSGAFLMHANLRGADLRGADFTGADLRRTDFTGQETRVYKVSLFARAS